MLPNFSKIPNPCFVLDENLLRKNLEIIRMVSEQSDAKIILAFKGFSMWSVFPIVREYISGAAASSVHEARLCFEEMKVPAHTYSPAYTDEEFDQILKYSSHITFNSIAQFLKHQDRVKSYYEHRSIGLRVNPEYSEVGTALYNPCSPGSRLGILLKDMPDKLPDSIEGFHFHALCESSADESVKAIDSFEKKFSPYFHQLKWINMGGGHLMTRKGYDTNKLIERIKRFKDKYALEIILEPGAAFAWETGYLLSRVEDIVENNGVKTAILNVSFTAHMPDCLEMPYKPRIIGASDEIPGKPCYRMGGNSCLSGDFMGNWSFDKELKIGDEIVFEDMIHYTMVKTTTFNGVSHPHIGIWKHEGYQHVTSPSYEIYKFKLS